MLQSLDRREKYFLGTVVGLLLLVITLPYLWAWAITPAGFHYSGLLYNPDDQNVHLAWARQAYEGHLTLRDAFTTESLNPGNQSLFINLYTSALGTVARITHLPIIWVSHLFRLIFAALAMLWFYDLCSQLVASVRTRSLALLFAAFSTGVGWLMPFFPGHVFMDRPDMTNFAMMPEAYVFTSAFIFGLNIASLALMVLTYAQLLKAEDKQSWKHLAVATIAAFLLANIHTYDAVPMLGILVLWLAWRLIQRKSTFKALAVGTVMIGLILPVIYQYWVLQNDTQFLLKALTYTQAPPLLDVLLSYGVVLVLAVVGSLFILRKRPRPHRLWLAIAWVLVTLGVIYIPALLGHALSFERKMIEGMHWPLCLLAAIGLVWCGAKIHSRFVKNAMTAAVLMISCISSFQFVAWSIQNAQDNNRSRLNVLMPPLYLSTSDQAALQYLETHGNQQEAVLSLTFVGNYIPQKTGMTVYLGHWAETIDYQQKLSQTVQFFKGDMSANAAREWLLDNHIGYVLIGSYERQLGATLPLSLEPVFTQGETVIYKVE